MNPKINKKIVVISMNTSGFIHKGVTALEILAKAHGNYIGTCQVREGGRLPALADFDVLLSSGGPGDPSELGDWGQAYADLIEAIRIHNREHPDARKRVFLICHSFQIMSYYWGLGQLVKRDHVLWGIHPQIPQSLPENVSRVFPRDEFHTLESRFFQVMPTFDIDQRCIDLNVVVAAKDKAGALTAWQTRDGHMAAVQFHPEAGINEVRDLIDNRPVGTDYCINMCPPVMVDDTIQRLHLLPIMEQMLVDFITKTV